MRNLLFLLLISFSLPTLAATWYVRPASGGTYGSDNGTSYANAWNSMADVVWGVSGVNSGDTLKICSSSSSPFTTADYDGGGLAVLSVDQSGVTVDGDCSSDGGGTIAYVTGNSTRDYGLYCADNTTCPTQTWKNIQVMSTDVRGFYVRNALTATNTATFVGTNLSCSGIIGTEGNTPQCIAGFGTGATLTNITSTVTTDDSIHWEGDNFSLDTATLTYPGYQVSTNLGDCVQVATQADNAIVRNVTCDHRNSATKQCVIFTANASDDNAEITNVTCLYPTTGNDTNQNKPLYSDVPGTIFKRNYVLGGYYGIYMLGAGSTAESNVIVSAELRGIDAVSTVSSGTHRIHNNTVYGVPSCFVINGGASVTTLMYNNLAVNCSTAGFTKGGSSTLTQSNNACYANATCSNNAGTISLTSNPLFVGRGQVDSSDDFKLQSSSPYRGAGLTLNLGAIQDKGNRTCPITPNIGAWCPASGDEILTRTTRN